MPKAGNIHPQERFEKAKQDNKKAPVPFYNGNGCFIKFTTYSSVLSSSDSSFSVRSIGSKEAFTNSA